MPWKSPERTVFLLESINVGESNTVCICIVLQRTVTQKWTKCYNVNVNWFCRHFRVGSKRILGNIQSRHIMVALAGHSCTGVLYENRERAKPHPQYFIISWKRLKITYSSSSVAARNDACYLNPSFLIMGCIRTTFLWGGFWKAKQVCMIWNLMNTQSLISSTAPKQHKVHMHP